MAPGQGIVVTGAGSGIGAAIATRLRVEGARVVVSDIDPGAARTIADRIGAHAVPVDAATSDGVGALIEEATDHLGEIDAFFANAGIIGGAGLDTPDDQWTRTLDVNLMAHVRAARVLVPRWVERGQGRFVVTASAAGLLTMIGAAPYSVSKHAAVAFAEWLSMTYGDKGVVVQAICPQGVRTPMFEESRRLVDVLSDEGAVDADQVADDVWTAMQDNRFLILPHPEVSGYYRFRAADTDGWLAGMRKLQARYEKPTTEPA